MHVELSGNAGSDKITCEVSFWNCLNKGRAKLEIIVGKASKKQHCFKIFLKIKACRAHVFKEGSNLGHIFSCMLRPDMHMCKLMEFKETTGKSGGSKKKGEGI